MSIRSSSSDSSSSSKDSSSSSWRLSTSSSSSKDSSSSSWEMSSSSSSSSSTTLSTSSSSSSKDSHSSESSSSYQYSVSSESSGSSKSSFSYLSQSSTSSLDSSSSSSESVGNVSTSSSSSIEIWNKGKPLVLANSAINGMSIINQLSQAILTDELYYDIGKVYVYLYGPFGDVNAGTITMTFGTADDDGKPLTTVATASIAASSVNGDGWYPFAFNVSGTTPANNYLCYTMSMTDMDENNYVMWGYSEYNGDNNKAYMYVGSQWEFHPYVLRSLKVTGEMDLFDLTNFQITSPSGVLAENDPSIGGNSASYNQTQLLASPTRVEIENPDTIVSFVVDASGSMGWNDRFKNRTDFIDAIYDRFSTGYGSNWMFDYIRFGSIVLDVSLFRNSLGQVATINLDLANPTRTL